MEKNSANLEKILSIWKKFCQFGKNSAKLENLMLKASEAHCSLFVPQEIGRFFFGYFPSIISNVDPNQHGDFGRFLYEFPMILAFLFSGSISLICIWIQVAKIVQIWSTSLLLILTNYKLVIWTILWYPAGRHTIKEKKKSLPVCKFLLYKHHICLIYIYVC